MSTRVSRRLFEGTRALGTRAFSSDYELEVHQCGTCGVVWGIEKSYMEARRNDHEGWVCPNGHSFVFNGPSEEEKLRRELERERDSRARLRARLDQTEAALVGTKAAKTRFKNERDRLKQRASAGVCPCCNRTFKQLARHMQTKHPEHVVSPTASAESSAC